MLRTQDLLEWFEVQAAGIVSPPEFQMDELAETPNRACALTITGGLGLEMEDALDRPTFRLLVRGVSWPDAERLGLELDRIWIDAPPSFDLGDYRVVGKGRFGGPPAYVGVDPSETYKDRVLRSATYWLRIAR